MPQPKRNIFYRLLSIIYGTITQIRNFLFDANIFRTKSFPIPIIGVGNLAVGGTGKTPHVEFLIDILKKEHKTAVLSRGYRRKTKGFRLASINTDTAETIGDEPFQILGKFPETIVAVDENRVHGVNELLNLHPETEVIILDDCFQHRKIKAGLSILLTDFHRLYCDDFMLPYGSLREYPKNSKRADIVIVTKCDADFRLTDKSYFERKLNILPHQKLFFSAFEYAPIYKAFDNAEVISEIGENDDILLLTGIANPQPALNHLMQFSSKISTLFYDDHHNFTANEIAQIDEYYSRLPEGSIIVTTEKDAARLKSYPFLTEKIKQNLFVLPLKIKILNNEQDLFIKTINEYVGKNSRNG